MEKKFLKTVQFSLKVGRTVDVGQKSRSPVKTVDLATLAASVMDCFLELAYSVAC